MFEVVLNFDGNMKIHDLNKMVGKHKVVLTMNGSADAGGPEVIVKGTKEKLQKFVLEFTGDIRDAKEVFGDNGLAWSSSSGGRGRSRSRSRGRRSRK